MDVEADPDTLIGEVIASRYRVEARLGHGAMGTVYRARHIKVGRPFAIKVLHPQFLADDKARRRFAREAELAGSLHHPNIVSVVDAGETPERLRYLVMEYVDGSTLYSLIGAAAPMPAARVISLVRQLCDGLDHAHERGLIHRDFKTENVIVERDAHGAEVPRIADFGIAILRDEATSSSSHRLTTAGLVLGTPHYMAPEHATGGAIDHRIDLFALGVICFEMLTGVPPFDGDGVDVARANLLTETPAMNARVPGLEVDPLLEALTRKLMMKSRDERPASARAVRRLIDLIEHDRAAAAEALDPPATVTSQRIWAPHAVAAVNSPVANPPVAGPALAGAAGAAERATVVSPTPEAAPRDSGPSARDLPSLRIAPWVDDTERMPPVPSRRGTLVVAVVAGLAVLFAVILALRPHRARSIVPIVRAPIPHTAPMIDAGAVDAAPTSTELAPAEPPASEPAPLAAAPEPRPRGLTRTIAKPAQIAARSAISVRPSDPPPSPPSPPPPAVEPPVAVAPPAADDASSAPAPHLELSTSHQVPAPTPAAPTTPAGVARLYATVGKQLKALDLAHGSAATADLWLLYLRVKINDVIANPVKCAEADALLRHLGEEISRRSIARSADRSAR